MGYIGVLLYFEVLSCITCMIQENDVPNKERKHWLVSLFDIEVVDFQTITTPTKAYTLRNRDVPRQQMGDPITFDLSACDDDLMAEAEPEHLKEQAYEALTDEIRKLQVSHQVLMGSSHEAPSYPDGGDDIYRPLLE